VGDHAVYVGIRRKAPISYNLLEPPQPLKIPSDFVKGWGMSEGPIGHSMRIAKSRLQDLSVPIRGYCGWLMTNPVFVAEHDRLLVEYRDQLQQHDFPKPPLMGQPLSQCESDEVWGAAIREFYSRWRLQVLVGPGLPYPLPVTVPSIPAMAGTLAAAEGGVSIFLPDIIPVPARGALSEIIDDAVHGSPEPEHLAEWRKIIGRHNTAKNMIPAYTRRFMLQHYWRIVQMRHAAALKRKAVQVRSAFAEYLGVSDSSIRKDLELITERLGRGWELRPNPLA